MKKKFNTLIILLNLKFSKQIVFLNPLRQEKIIILLNSLLFYFFNLNLFCVWINYFFSMNWDQRLCKPIIIFLNTLQSLDHR